MVPLRTFLKYNTPKYAESCCCCLLSTRTYRITALTKKKHRTGQQQWVKRRVFFKAAADGDVRKVRTLLMIQKVVPTPRRR
jgi:hypothetical protein